MNSPGISFEVLAEYKKEFDSEPRFRLARNICTKEDPYTVVRKRSTEEELQHVFTHKVDIEGKPVTNQKKSGRCWIFSCLNTMRLSVMKEFNVEEFEFSQNYLFFWDKVERMNFTLHAYIETARRGETPGGRLVHYLTRNPTDDGGQWNMLVNLIEKHGLMPKVCFPESWSSENSEPLREITNYKLREFCLRLQKMVKSDASDSELQTEVKVMMGEIYRIISICLGTPAETFTWEYYDKDKKYQKIGPIRPLDFYRQYVKPHFNVADKVVLVTDPRPTNRYNTLYTVEYLNNMVGGKPTRYINQDPLVLKKLAAESIKNNEAVWFGSDVRQHCSWEKHGIHDLDAHDFELVFGTSLKTMTKADRLICGESLMTHAMTLTACSIKDDRTTKWRVENSWGEEGGNKGYLAMTDDWFTEFVYEIVVDKRFVPSEVLAVLDEEPTVLPVWDPMGSLARATV